MHINELMESERTLDKRKNTFSQRHSVSRCSSWSRTAPCRLTQVTLRLWRHYSLKASAFLGSAGQHSLNWLIMVFKSKSKVCYMFPVVVKGVASFHAMTSVHRRNRPSSVVRGAHLLTEVVCNLPVQYYLLGITRLRYTKRPRVLY